jgi:methylenetetrahydrofolate--tRNA-(uracil-5-)-methyltransferase
VIHIIGGGLAGSEAAWQAAAMGVPVTIYEMRPVRPTAVHHTDHLAELVCSNSFRGDKLDNAVGLLKEEMRRLGSLVMRVADRVRVPAGAALAVDRARFAEGVTAALTSHPLIRVERREVPSIPASAAMSPVIVATGPLTSDALSADIASFVGREHLAFFDAISPIVLAETIDMSTVFRQSRWGRSLTRPMPVQEGTGIALQALSPLSLIEGLGSSVHADALSPLSVIEGTAGRDLHDSSRASKLPTSPLAGTGLGERPLSPSDARSRTDELHTTPRAGTGLGERPLSPLGRDPISPEGDYLNCPFTKDEYLAFHEAILSAEKAAVHDFDSTKFFEGCLPIEVMAHRGVDTLRFGPMKPAGLTDPRTGRWPYAVVQLRQDTLAGDHYSLVGFQTQLKWGEQARVLRMIPGLERAEFVRFGMIHRNTYINAPTVLNDTWQTRGRADLFFAGQVSGVEGYVESAASGLIAGRNAARLVLGKSPVVPPRTTAIGALGYYVAHADPRHYDPSNITFGIIAPLDAPPKSRQERQLATSRRALDDLDRWTRECGDAAMREVAI